MSIRFRTAVEVASGPAVRGPWRQNESNYRWVDDPAVALDAAGEAAVVWVDQARKDVLFQRFARDGAPRLAAPTVVSRSPRTFSWLPRVAVRGGRVHVLWQEILFSGGSHGGDIEYARSEDDGRTFEEPLNLSASQAGDGKGRLDAQSWDNGSLALALSPEGDVYALWTEYEGALWLRRSDNGATFSRAVQIGGTRAAPARAPALAVSGRGRLVAAWALGESRVAPIQIALSDDSGASIRAAAPVGAAGAHCDAPELALGSDGVVHLVFAQSLSGRGGVYRVQYTRWRPGRAGFDPPRALRHPKGESARASESFPALKADDAGRLFVLWERFELSAPRATALSITYSLDGGDTFAPPITVPHIAGEDLGTSGSQQGLLTDKLAAGTAGEFAVVNSTFLPGRASRVWLLRGRWR